MRDFLVFLFNDDSWGRFLPLLVSILIAISYAFLLKNILKRKREIENLRRSDFIKKSYSALRQDSLKELGDIRTLFEGIFKRESGEDGNRKFGGMLKELYAEIVSDDSTKNSPDYSNRIRSFIKELETNEPFEGVPDPERTILKDALAFVDANNPNEIKRKLYEISNAILGRNNSILDLQSTSKKNWTITVASIVITVISIATSILTWIFK